MTTEDQESSSRNDDIDKRDSDESVWPIMMTSSPAISSDNGSEDNGSPEPDINAQEMPRLNLQYLRGGRPLSKPNQNGMHPLVQTLSLRDLESCLALETATFPPAERCTREKLDYRLTNCPELCLGLFNTFAQPQSPDDIPTYPHAQMVDDATPERRQTLIAMILSTKTASSHITDEAMELPQPEQPHLGHRPAGRTICLHSLAVLPSFQRQGFAKTLLRSYQQRMETSGIADRIALIAHDHMVDMYVKLGFQDDGDSHATHGGGTWRDMSYVFGEYPPGS